MIDGDLPTPPGGLVYLAVADEEAGGDLGVKWLLDHEAALVACDDRRTEIIAETSDISVEDLIAEEDMVITVSRSGYVKRSALTAYRAQRRGGRGRRGMATKAEDEVWKLFIASTHATMLFFTSRGRVFARKVHELPDVGPGGRGRALINLLQVEDDEQVAALLVEVFTPYAWSTMEEALEEGVQILLERGWEPYRVLTEALVGGMKIVGDDFRDVIMFVHEVLLSANAMKAGLAILKSSALRQSSRALRDNPNSWST